MSTVDYPRSLPPVLVHTTEKTFSVAYAHAASSATSGLVLSGPPSVAHLRSTQMAHPDLPLVLDNGAWRSTYATARRPLAYDHEDAFVPIDLDTYVGDLVALGASHVLTPSLTLGAPGWLSALDATTAAMHRVTRPEHVPYFVIDAALLDDLTAPLLAEKFATFPDGVALTVVGHRDGLAAYRRLRALRGMVDSRLVRVVLATEPLIATDVVARAGCASVGVLSGLRTPAKPGGAGPASKAWEPGVFDPDLLEFRSPSVYANWHAGAPSAPTCGHCRLPFTIYRAANRDNYLAHNLHALTGLVHDLLAQDPDLRSRWLVARRADALSRHPWALARPAASKVLRRLVDLDEPDAQRVSGDAWSG